MNNKIAQLKSFSSRFSTQYIYLTQIPFLSSNHPSTNFDVNFCSSFIYYFTKQFNCTSVTLFKVDNTTFDINLRWQKRIVNAENVCQETVLTKIKYKHILCNIFCHKKKAIIEERRNIFLALKDILFFWMGKSIFLLFYYKIFSFLHTMIDKLDKRGISVFYVWYIRLTNLFLFDVEIGTYIYEKIYYYRPHFVIYGN